MVGFRKEFHVLFLFSKLTFSTLNNLPGALKVSGIIFIFITAGCRRRKKEIKSSVQVFSIFRPFLFLLSLQTF